MLCRLIEDGDARIEPPRPGLSVQDGQSAVGGGRGDNPIGDDEEPVLVLEGSELLDDEAGVQRLA